MTTHRSKERNRRTRAHKQSPRRKTIAVADDVYEMLARDRRPGESFSDVVRRWLRSEGGSVLFDASWDLGPGPATDSSDDDATLYRRKKRRDSSSTRARS